MFAKYLKKKLSKQYISVARITNSFTTCIVPKRLRQRKREKNW